jgi:hypothetical protein
VPRPHVLSTAFLSVALVFGVAGCGDPNELDAEPGVASEQQDIVNGNTATAYPGNAIRLPGLLGGRTRRGVEFLPGFSGWTNITSN